MTCSNSTDRKILIKRRADGVYDIYLNDKFIDSRGSAVTATKFVEELLMEE